MKITPKFIWRRCVNGFLWVVSTPFAMRFVTAKFANGPLLDFVERHWYHDLEG